MITRTHEGAGAILPAPGAFTDSTSRQPVKVIPILAAPQRRPNRPAQRRAPHFDPNAEQTRCSSCGGRSGWLGGAWAHCISRELAEAEHLASDLDHQCSAGCLLAGGGAA
jgi:hypothetical protein